MDRFGAIHVLAFVYLLLRGIVFPIRYNVAHETTFTALFGAAAWMALFAGPLGQG